MNPAMDEPDAPSASSLCRIEQRYAPLVTTMAYDIRPTKTPGARRMDRHSRHARLDSDCRTARRVAARGVPGADSRDGWPLVVECTRAYAVATDRARATVMIDAAAEQRWTAWRLQGVRRDAVRVERMRALFVVALLAPMLWLIWHQ